MSLYVISSGFLSIKPRIWTDETGLHARSSLLLQLLSLFSYTRKVSVRPHERGVSIDTRYLWFVPHSEEISFDEIHYIDYDFQSMGTSWGYAGGDMWGRQDQVESFIVSLVLHKKSRKVRLFRFMGEGAVDTGWSGVLIGGDSMVDMAGDQETSSRRFVDVLAKTIGVSVGRPIPHLADATGNYHYCTACKRPNAPTVKKCIYCGAALEAVQG